MKLIIDVVLLAIIALSTWGGYKRGLVGGIAGVLAIIVAVFGGTLLSSAYAGEVFLVILTKNHILPTKYPAENLPGIRN